MSRFAGWNYWRYLVPTVVGTAVVVLLGSQFSGYSLSDLQVSNASTQSVSAEDQIVLFAPSATRYEFGVLERGGHAEKVFALHNPGTIAVTVTGITTSCECLRVELVDRVIEPGESVSGTVAVDFREEPQFAGDLILQVEGMADDGKLGPAFVIQIGVSVR
jgi:hypothetical protein